MSTLTELNPWNLLDTLLDTNNRVFRNVCPGKAAKDVDLTLEAQAVIIADKPADTTDENGKAIPVKPSWSRRVELPFRVDHEKANAKFINGILRIELPRADAVAAHRIKIA